MPDLSPEDQQIANRIVRDAMIDKSLETGDFALADRLRVEKLHDPMRPPETTPEEREAAITALRVDSDAAAAKGDFGLAARLKAEWLRHIEL